MLFRKSCWLILFSICFVTNAKAQSIDNLLNLLFDNKSEITQTKLNIKHDKQIINHNYTLNSTDHSFTPILATWYGNQFHGRKTASGEIFNSSAMTAAHKSLPFGTKVMIVNPVNNKQLIIRINDRGPYRTGYSLDISQGSARFLNFNSGRLLMKIL